MKTLLLAAVLAAAPAMAGNLVLKNQDGSQELRLYDTPCSHGETLGILKPEWRARFKNARILNGKGHIVFYGCWLRQDDSAIVILSDGGVLDFPLSAFNDPSIWTGSNSPPISETMQTSPTSSPSSISASAIPSTKSTMTHWPQSSGLDR